MILETVKLLPFQDAALTACGLVPFDDLQLAPRRAVIVCPGGGYRFLSAREGYPIALQFAAAGFMPFLLEYTVGEGAADFHPLQQAALAVKYVRENAEKYCVDPDYVFVCGFSAGGHLAASIGTLWNTPAVAAVLNGASLRVARPTGTVLSYPVISAGVFAHKGSFRHLCGKDEPTEEELEPFSLEKHVSADTAPAFLWHTFPDATVPVQNSLMYAEALAAAGVPFELHIYPTGKHGLSLCNEQTANGKVESIIPHNAGWMDLAINWIRDLP